MPSHSCQPYHIWGLPAKARVEAGAQSGSCYTSWGRWNWWLLGSAQVLDVSWRQSWHYMSVDWMGSSMENRGTRNEEKILGLSKWGKNGLFMYWDVKACKRRFLKDQGQGGGKTIQSSVLDILNLRDILHIQVEK